VKREISFANLGKVLVILGFVLYAGCVLPVTQVWCVLVCLEGMSMEPDVIESSYNAKVAAGSSNADCHSPSSTELLVISHNSEEWAPNFEIPMASVSEARFEPHQGKLIIDVPDLSIISPPPKSPSLA
jgi:hypothetical protein